MNNPRYQLTNGVIVLAIKRLSLPELKREQHNAPEGFCWRFTTEPIKQSVWKKVFSF